MKLALLVGIGSFFGGIFRYALSMIIQSKNPVDFPYGTFAVNLIGCFLIGCLFGLSEKWQISYELRLLLITGLLGGFTTFSAFSAETHYLFERGHSGIGLLYVAATVILGIGLTFVGGWLFR